MSEDQEWKPSGRPTSTMAQAFSASLDSAFSLDTDVTQLSQNVDHKRHQMMIQNRELEALQRKIREAEERLKTVPEGTDPKNGTGQQESTGSPFASSRSERTARLFGRDGGQRELQGRANNNS